MADPASRPDAPLSRYRQKRNFKVTAEPSGTTGLARRKADERPGFVVQKHWASRLHYDFRLEHRGVLLSWAVPKGPSYDPSKMQMAIHVEDHPLDYGSFEGTIPPRQYGAGTVIVWDRGTWEPVGDVDEGMQKGKLVFRLHGEKLAGLWELVRIAKPGDKQDAWMLFKKRDEWARPLAEYDVIAALPDSVVARPLGPLEEREPRGTRLRTAAAASVDAHAAPELAAAVKAPLPAKLEPQLATLVAAPPTGDWLVETKFDGYRLMARVDKGRARLITRGGHDWTDKMPALAQAVEALGFHSAWLDGEIVVLGEAGVPDFNALQNAIDSASSEAIEYFVFDLPFHAGRDLRKVPLLARRALLEEIVERHPNDRVRLSRTIDAPPLQVLEAARRMSLEGIILKRPDAPYVSQRTETWLKLKVALRQEFVICGFTDRSNAAREVGSLLLGTYGDGELVYSGNVGTGWNARTGRELHERLVALETKTPTLDVASVKPGRWSRRTAGGERWVRPELVAEVSFREWTPDGHIRHAVFGSLRADKPAKEVTREVARVPDGAVASAAPMASSVKVTNPERVIDPSTGLTKVALVRYYESIAERMLPHLKDRPVSLVRAPEGIGGELFFQKHPETRMPGLRILDAKLWPGHGPLLAVDTADALLSAAQMNTIEFHTWNSTVRHIDRPDRVVFDLDPGEGVTWAHILEAAVLMRAMLTELKLESWLKTSGGKGLHVVVPLAPKLDDETVKGVSQAIVQHLARAIPQRFVAKSGGANRVGRIFVDYLRNGHGQTTAAAFSARSRPGLGVSMPVSWEQLMSLKGGAQWTIATAREYLSFEPADPWAGYWNSRQTLAAAMKILSFRP
ncbi:MAG TPA: DNA ligase D [Caldimonas sp.]|jgi:bifunctional non-homologous end joining protein LigD|nr:DNA ligase D [Caldimonas sp.]HEX2539718.1 DNA ligase D [Caldimonas sp.]